MEPICSAKLNGCFSFGLFHFLSIFLQFRELPIQLLQLSIKLLNLLLLQIDYCICFGYCIVQLSDRLVLLFGCLVTFLYFVLQFCNSAVQGSYLFSLRYHCFALLLQSLVLRLGTRG